MFMFLSNLIHEKRPLFFALVRAQLRPLATNRKSKGERGHPCLSSLSEVNKGEASPLMRKTKEVVEMQQKSIL